MSYDPGGGSESVKNSQQGQKKYIFTLTLLIFKFGPFHSSFVNISFIKPKMLSIVSLTIFTPSSSK